MSFPVSELQVDSDLQLDIDGVAARLVSDGGRLTLSTQDAGLLLTRVVNTAPSLGAPVRGLVAELAATLDAVGLAVALTDERGLVAELGRGCGSALGRRLLGSAYVRIGPVSFPVAVSVARGSQTFRRRATYAVGGALVLLVGAVGLRRGPLGSGAP